MEYANLSLDEIRQHLETIEQNKSELQRALVTRRQEAKQGVVQQIRDLISHNGYELDEIVPLIQTRRRRGAAATPRATPSGRDYTRYVDPENAQNIYVRGVLPGWMKQKMQEQGYDASKKADREAFKANYLQVLEA
ncbi:H-NS histone family protein [uncultured Thiodictyon sp.]|uniref:H-NS histone family protein n=1 Tax=uncultured Thiodictyon sp. TaxID=1846217 RepID=UPI0025F9DF94|nr:H-NS histone family protein [uncultured Thiodictyon sp.]